MLAKAPGLGPEYGAQFQDSAIAAAYAMRPPYPAETFAAMGELLAEGSGAVLDIGCGSGDLAVRLAPRLAPRVTRVDAVDASAAMVAVGRARPGGDHPNLRWHVAPMETAPLEPPYALVTAAESLHWMDWPVVLPRLRAALVPGGVLAIVERAEEPGPWSADIGALCRRYSTNKDYQPYDLVAELESRELFRMIGERRTAAVPFAQPIWDYIEAFHSRNGLSRDRMTAADASAFDAGVEAVLRATCPCGLVPLRVASVIVWGEPGGERGN
jgi:SAM-dependent methyltransferase